MNPIRLRAVLTVAAMALASCAFAQQPPAPTPMTIVIDEAGPAWKKGRPFAEQDLAPHLAYVAKRFNNGDVVAYGTEANDSVVRGYYVLAGAEPSTAREFAAGDPGVASGVLALKQAHPWMVAVNGFAEKRSGQAYSILRMVPGPRWVADLPITQQEIGPHFSYMVEQSKAGIVVAAGPDGSGQQGWYVIRGDRAAVEKLLERDPATRSGLLKPVIVGWNVVAMRSSR